MCTLFEHNASTLLQSLSIGEIFAGAVCILLCRLSFLTNYLTSSDSFFGFLQESSAQQSLPLISSVGSATHSRQEPLSHCLGLVSFGGPYLKNRR